MSAWAVVAGHVLTSYGSKSQELRRLYQKVREYKGQGEPKVQKVEQKEGEINRRASFIVLSVTFRLFMNKYLP